MASTLLADVCITHVHFVEQMRHVFLLPLHFAAVWASSDPPLLPPPLTGIHLSDSDAQVHFGPNMECTLTFRQGPSPFLESNCPIAAPPQAPSTPPPPATPPQSPPPPPAHPPSSPQASRFMVFGGRQGCGNTLMNTAANGVMIFDTTSNTWTAVSKPSTVQTQSRLAYLNGMVYQIGGGYGGYTNRVFRYDTANDANGWTQMASMTYHRSEPGTVVHNDRIYALGGYNPSIYNCENKAEVYNPATNAWTSIATMPHRVCGHPGAFSVGNYIYQAAAPYFWMRYDPSSDTWAMMTNINADERSNTPGAVHNGFIYLIAGHGRETGEPHGNERFGMNSVSKYDPATDQWTNVASLPTSDGFIAGSVRSPFELFEPCRGSRCTGRLIVRSLSRVPVFPPCFSCYHVGGDHRQRHLLFRWRALVWHHLPLCKQDVSLRHCCRCLD